MSSGVLPNPLGEPTAGDELPAPPAPPGPSAPSGPPAPPLSMPVRVLYEMFGRWGARLGMIWIAGLFLMAAFAPFLANSHPFIFLTTDEELSSPLLSHLTPQDLILLAALIAFVALWFVRSLAWRDKAMIFVGVLAVVAVASLLWVRPPTVVVYEQYREMQAAGKVEFALFAPIPYSPHDRLRDVADARLSAPSGQHWFGTDDKSASLLSKLIHATRIALAVGFIATGLSVLIGVAVGGVMGYFGGVLDLLGMRLVEIFEAIPTLFLLIAVTAFIEDRNIYIMMAIIGLTSWTGYTRFIRAEFFKLRNQDFVLAARACGLPLRSILFRHMLPNGVAPVLVGASFGVAGAILTESTLSFLGLGLGPGEPSWGQLLNQTLGAGGHKLWIIVYPGLAIFLTVFSYNLIGEALRDAIDPHTRRLQRTGA